MKKTLIALFLLVCSQMLNAQLMVDTQGNVGVKMDTTVNINSYLGVNTLGSSTVLSSFLNNSTDHLITMNVRKSGAHSDLSQYNIAGQFTTEVVQSRCNIGLHVRSVKSTTMSTGRSFGVLAHAGNATSGYNYGVFGSLCGSNNGAGVYGSAYEENGHDTGGRYAGYFHGNVKTTDILYAATVNTSSVVTPSDYRLKENIKSVDNGTLSSLMNLSVIEYNYIEQNSTKTRSDTANTAIEELYSSMAQKKHFGFIAQELQEIYPELVIEGEDGYLGVNYIEVIPLLLRSIQELNAKLEQYEDSKNVESVMKSTNTLAQNIPNPFSENTYIEFSLNKDVKDAAIYIYNMNGEQIAKYPISERGESGISIEGNSLKAGMYFYALIADEEVVDTKRMILTK